MTPYPDAAECLFIQEVAVRDGFRIEPHMEIHTRSCINRPRDASAHPAR